MESDLRTMKEDTPAEQAKKKASVGKLDQKYEELLVYSQRAYELYSDKDLQNDEKANYRKAVNQLALYYQKKKQADKALYYQQKLKEQ
jgi:hypothetical protein